MKCRVLIVTLLLLAGCLRASPVLEDGGPGAGDDAAVTATNLLEDDAVWPGDRPATAIGLTSNDTDIRPSLTGRVAMTDLKDEKPLYERMKSRTETGPVTARRRRWRPKITAEAAFYLGLAVLIAIVVILKARG